MTTSTPVPCPLAVGDLVTRLTGREVGLVEDVYRWRDGWKAVVCWSAVRRTRHRVEMLRKVAP